MKVLFVSSGKSGSVSVVVRNQGESLKREGVELDYFIADPGFLGYIKSIKRLRQKIKKGNYDIVHAHYSFSGFTAALAGCKPLVVTLMGSDVYSSAFWRIVIRFVGRFIWDAIIVKTQQMKNLLKIDNIEVIPNGVDLEKFRPIDKKTAREHFKLPLDNKIILFTADPSRPEKNFKLAEQSVTLLKKIIGDEIFLKCAFRVPNEEMPYFYNSADVLLVTSKWEGSNNSVKEAMACNCKVVMTDTGDARWLFKETEGYFVTSSCPNDISEKLKQALISDKLFKEIGGRKRIISLGLDSKTIAGKILEVYKALIARI